MIKVKSTSLDWALEHVKRFGDTDVLPKPFEYAAIEYAWLEIKDYLQNQDILT